MSEQIVRSYVRSYKQEANEEAPEQSNILGYVIGGGAVTILAITYIGTTLAIVALLGAVYGMKLVYLAPKPVATVEAVIEPIATSEDKPKRHYQKRITVNHYQLKKPVRV